MQQLRILTPVDFSDQSKLAARFALTMSKQMDADLILVHVLPDLGPTIGRHRTMEMLQEMQQSAENDFKSLIDEVFPGEESVSNLIVYASSVAKGLEAVMETNNITLIVMGSKGAGGVKRALLGSNAVDVINQCTAPVVIVPEHAMIDKITSLAYASDFTNLRVEIKALIPLAKQLKASINIINLPAEFYLEYVDTSRLVEDLQKENGFTDIRVELLQGENVIEILEEYVSKSNGELLTMFTHHHSFLDQLFRRSITREIAWHNKIPIMVLKSLDPEKLPT